MLHYTARRLAASCLLIFGLLTAVFFLVQAVPGDPVERYVEPGLDTENRALIRHRLGLDQPVIVQYWQWLSGVVVRGDFGESLHQHRPIAAIFAEAIPNTLLLTGLAYGLHLLLAVGGGVLTAYYRGRWAERLAVLGGLTVYSLPSFWFGLMLIMLFSKQLGWLPTGGMAATDAEFLPAHLQLIDRVRHLVLPVVVLGLGSAMSTTRYLRNALIEVLNQDYITAARARGLSESAVLWRHGLRNALLPVFTLIGLSLPFLLGGAVVVEVVFAWPGMGRVTVDAIFARDYPVIMATTALSAVLVVAGSFLADLLYYWADPRLRAPGETRQ